MAAAKEQALANLKLDDAFFQKLMRLDGSAVEDGQRDFDIYLMENGVMPLLLQGLDALSRHIDKMSSKEGDLSARKVPFNPRTWLAQYLLRNHPAKVKDHRTPMYKQLGEMASVERGRRSLLRRKGEIQDEWYEMVKDGALTLEDLPAFFQRLDRRWLLDGLFLARLPHQPNDLEQLLRPEPGCRKVLFQDFWEGFEKYASANDLLRVSDFEDAIRRKEDAARKERDAREQAMKRRVVQRHMKEQHRSYREQFDSICADIYTSDEMSQIMIKGATISGRHDPDPPGEGAPPEGEVSRQGDHIELLVGLLRLWGCDLMTDEEAYVWGRGAGEAWGAWVQQHGPEGSRRTAVDSLGLKRLIDADAYQEYLRKAFPVDDVDDDEEDHRVEVTAILDEHGGGQDVFVEAVDDATGQRMHLRLPAGEVAAVRRRLDGGRGRALYAQVNRFTNQITALHPEGATRNNMETPDIPDVDDDGDDD